MLFIVHIVIIERLHKRFGGLIVLCQRKNLCVLIRFIRAQAMQLV